MPPKHKAGGCGCCETCPQSVDLFDRADNDDMGSAWTEVTGDWDIYINGAYSTTAGSISVTTASYSGPHVIQALFNSAGNGGLIIAYKDSSNYVLAEFTDNSSMDLYQVIAGSPSYLGSSSVSWIGGATKYWVQVCYKPARNGESAIVTVDAPASLYSQCYRHGDILLRRQLHSTFDTGGQAGIYATFTSPATYSWFDSFGVYTIQNPQVGGTNYPENCRCCGCDCDDCAEPDMPLALEVTLSGVPSLSCGFVVNCSDANTTFELSCAGRLAASSCQWNGTFLSALCNSGINMQATLTESGGDYYLNLLIQQPYGTVTLNSASLGTSKPQSWQWSGVSLSVVSEQHLTGGCDFSSVSASLSTVP